jgi:hypothetical protein
MAAHAPEKISSLIFDRQPQIFSQEIQTTALA